MARYMLVLQHGNDAPIRQILETPWKVEVDDYDIRSFDDKRRCVLDMNVFPARSALFEQTSWSNDKWVRYYGRDNEGLKSWLPTSETGLLESELCPCIHIRGPSGQGIGYFNMASLLRHIFRIE